MTHLTISLCFSCSRHLGEEVDWTETSIPSEMVLIYSTYIAEKEPSQPHNKRASYFASYRQRDYWMHLNELNDDAGDENFGPRQKTFRKSNSRNIQDHYQQEKVNIYGDALVIPSSKREMLHYLLRYVSESY